MDGYEARHIAYALYVKEWRDYRYALDIHDELPMSYSEFTTNEYVERMDEMVEMFTRHGLEDWIDVYIEDACRRD